MVSMCEVYGAFSGGNHLNVTRKLNEMQKPDSRTDYSHCSKQWQRVVQQTIPSPFTRGFRVRPSPQCHVGNFSD